jgi:eukaryotic-like serine/threonine-protein kinase
MEDSTAQRRVGTTLRGKYRLDRLLGVGGMAAVYAGSHRNGLAVAVKVLHPWAAAEPTIVERFVREGYIANAIDHPGAVRVLDDDVSEDGAGFLVMELLDGRALADLAPHGPAFPLAAALDAADQLLDVLAAAHAKQIVHRDLKPDNLFVTNAGQLKVLDLGIARMRGITGNTVATRSGALMGTPGFMPPEQVLGEQEKIDARSDVWAVGATLFALLTGHVVHEAATPEQTMLRAATSAVPPLATMAPQVPPPICAVIDRALAMAQDSRWPDARSMQVALRAALEQSRLPSFAKGEALARAFIAPAFANTHPATTGARLALSAGVATPAPPTPTKKRARRIALVAGIAALSATIGGAAFVAKTRTHVHAAKMSVIAPETAAPAVPPAPPPAPTVTEAPAPAVAPSAVPAPTSKKSHAKPTQRPALQAAASSPPPPPPAPAAGAGSDPFDRP